MARLAPPLLVALAVLLVFLSGCNGFARPWAFRGSCSSGSPLLARYNGNSGGGSGGGGGGGGGGKYTNPPRSSGPGARRGGVQLDRAEGSRPLTKSELKAKEQYEASRDPFVERVLDKFSPDRSKLADLTPGLKTKGRIISIKEFGMFVDVGSEKDGLVHIKDISKDYFVQNHASKFSPGQDLDVWVKFVDAEGNKLGLQMYPLPAAAAARAGAGAGAGVDGEGQGQDRAAELSALRVGDAVTGTVVRVSGYGVFVDVGQSFSSPSLPLASLFFYSLPLFFLSSLPLFFFLSSSSRLLPL